MKVVMRAVRAGTVAAIRALRRSDGALLVQKEAMAAPVGVLLRRGEARLELIAEDAKILDPAEPRVVFAEGLAIPILWSLHDSRFIRYHVRMYGGFYFIKLIHDYNFTLS